MPLYAPPEIGNAPDLKRLCARAMGRAEVIFGSVSSALQKLRPILDERLFSEIGDLFAQEALSEEELSRADELLAEPERADSGVFFTPKRLAGQMCGLFNRAPGRVCDPSCGAGELLLAAHRRWATEVVGIEFNPFLALVAGIRLARAGADARVLWGDALAIDLHDVDLVVSNPPYVGEKGRKELFDAIRTAHPGLESRFSARMDLAYLFMHHAMDLSENVILLTSEYWLTADSARGLRKRLSMHEPVYCHRLGKGVFESAPGHHSLITTLGFEPNEVFEDRGRVRATNDAEWFPFATGSIDDFSGLMTLDELADDHQGFVSGLDRATARHSELEQGTPFFIAARDEIDETQRHGAGWWRPLLRARDCEKNRVFVEPPSNDYVLWLDDEISLKQPTRRLEPARQRLSERREVKKGSMPWYRIHWPRRREDQVGPKLVVPRRAREAAFCLDLSASHVSSDCTYLIADDERPIELLVRLMISLNSDETARYLRDFAKRKGDIIEFYSSPLKRIPVFLKENGSDWTLMDEKLERQASGILADLGMR